MEPGPAYQIAPAPAREDRGEQAILKQYRLMRCQGRAATLTAVVIDGVLLLFADGKQVGRIVLSGS
jgi:hypothetical protein